MTGQIIQLSILGMAKPGRRPSSSLEYRRDFIRRTRAAREKAGLSQEEMAAELTRRSGRTIVYDTYRKWEKEEPKKGALLPHDLITHFCDITRTHPYELLGPIPFLLKPSRTPAASRRRPAA